jgi:hypothetical protein
MRYRGGGMKAIGLIFLLLLLACAQPVWRAQYLNEQLNVGTQAQVRDRIGEPQETRRDENGEELWTYRLGKNARYGDPATYGEGSPLIGSGECVAYTLRFDPQKVLRSWLRQECA